MLSPGIAIIYQNRVAFVIGVIWIAEKGFFIHFSDLWYMTRTTLNTQLKKHNQQHISNENNSHDFAQNRNS